MTVPTLESPRALIRRYGLRARKRFGQHFLVCPDTVAVSVAAVDLARTPNVIEIGPGPGVLTRAALAKGAHVCAIERDADLCAFLRDDLGGHPCFHLVEGDAVTFDYGHAFPPSEVTSLGVPSVLGNLPYNLTGPLLFALLTAHRVTGRWVVMVQKEVGDRLLAPPGHPDYGGLSIAIGRLRAPRLLAVVPPERFDPAPRVFSSVLELAPREVPLGEVPDDTRFLAFVRIAFQKRRKMLRNSLRGFADGARVDRALATTGIDPTLRPEDLSASDFAALFRALVEPADA